MKPQNVVVVILAAVGFGCDAGPSSPSPGPSNGDDWLPPEIDWSGPDDVEPGPLASQLPALDSPLVLRPMERLAPLALEPAIAFDAEGRLAIVATGKMRNGFLGPIGSLWLPTEPPTEAVRSFALSNGDSDGMPGPRICALADSGAAAFAVAWLMDGDLHTRVLAAPFSPLGFTEHRVVSPPGASLGPISLACASAEGGGFVVATTVPTEEYGQQVMFHRFDASGAPFGDWVVPDVAGRRVQTAPAVAVGPTGDVFVAYGERDRFNFADYTESSIILAHFDPAGAVAIEALDAVLPPSVVEPAIGVVEGGLLVGASQHGSLRFAWRDASGLWVTAPNPDGTSATTFDASVAPIGGRRAAVAWTRERADELHEVRFALFDGGAFVTEPVTLATGLTGAGGRPSVAIRDGRVAVAYTERGSGTFAVRVAVARLPDETRAP